MAQVRAIIDGTPMALNESGHWDSMDKAAEFPIPEAERRVRVNNINNRFLDREDQVEAYVSESR